VLSYLRWFWKEAPRPLRIEILLTVLAIEVAGLATASVLARQASPMSSTIVEDVGEE
jgi:hypothetical protein